MKGGSWMLIRGGGSQPWQHIASLGEGSLKHEHARALSQIFWFYWSEVEMRWGFKNPQEPLMCCWSSEPLNPFSRQEPSGCSTSSSGDLLCDSSRNIPTPLHAPSQPRDLFPSERLVSYIPTGLLPFTIFDFPMCNKFCTCPGDWPEPPGIHLQTGNTAPCSG